MLSFVKSLFNRKRADGWAQEHGCFVNEAGEVVYQGEAVPQYPPFIKGFPVIPSALILKTQEHEVNNIYDALEFTKVEFEQLIIPVFKNFIAYVHLLPASERHHHRTQGGMAHHCLEAAFNAAQISRAQIFATGSTVREKRDNEERWRVAAMLAGLLHDLGKPATDYTVTDDSGEQKWLPYIESLEEWIVRNKVKRYFLRWNAQRHKKHEQHASLVLYRILTKEIIEYLCLHGTEILQAIDAAISGRDINKPLARIMMEADQASVARDLKRNQIEGASSGFGVPVERYIFEAIRNMISSQTWTVNKAGSRVWLIKGEGAFIDLAKGEAELFAEIQKSKIPGVPRRADTIADLLTERGYAIGCPTQTEGVLSRYWSLKINVDSGRGAVFVPMTLLKLDSPELIFAGEPPVAIEGVVEHEETVSTSQKSVSKPTIEKSVPAHSKAGAKGKTKETPESTDGSEERPRDFNQLMDDLAKVEGEHQPDLNSSVDSEEQATEDEKADLGSTSQQSSGAEESSSKAKDAVSDIIERLSERVRSERTAVTDSINLGPKETEGSVISAKQAAPEQPKPSPADEINLAPESSKPSQSKPKPKLKPKAKQKTIEEEIAAETKKLEIEKRKAQRDSMLEINPAAMQECLAGQQAALTLNTEAPLSLDFLTPKKDSSSKKASVPVKTVQPKPKLGPGASQRLEKLLPETVTLEPKMPPKSNKPAKQKTKPAPNKNLHEKLVEIFGVTAEQGLLSLTQEVTRVVNREVPLGVTIHKVDETYRVESGVLGPKAIEILCSDADCDIETDGALLLGEKLSEAIHAEIQAAEQAALREIEHEHTENVTYQEPSQELVEAEYRQVTASDAIAELIEQFYAFGGDMVAPDFRVSDGTVHINARQTHSLIQRKYQHLSSKAIRKAMIEQKLLFRGLSYQYTLKDQK